MKKIFGSVAIGLTLVASLLVGLAFVATSHQAAYAAGEDGTRDVLTPTTVLNTGITQTLTAASGDGHKFANTGNDFIVATNDYTATVTLTVVTGGTVGGIAIEDVDVTVGAGGTRLIGPFNKSIFDQPSGTDAGKIYLNWDAAVTGTVASSVTIGVYRTE